MGYGKNSDSKFRRQPQHQMSFDLKGKGNESFLRPPYFYFHDGALPYYHVNDHLSAPNSIEWGFDNAVVLNELAWHSFLKKWDFEEVARAPNVGTHHNPRVYKNSGGVIIVTQSETDDEKGRYHLGHVRFEFPVGVPFGVQNADALKVLGDFRGNQPRLRGVEVDPKKSMGILVFTNEEVPNSAQFI